MSPEPEEPSQNSNAAQTMLEGQSVDQFDRRRMLVGAVGFFVLAAGGFYTATLGELTNVQATQDNFQIGGLIVTGSRDRTARLTAQRAAPFPHPSKASSLTMGCQQDVPKSC